MSSETLDEARRDIETMCQHYCESIRCSMPGPCTAHAHGRTERLIAAIAAERADAERVQRELAGAARHETERMRQAWMVQRERADAWKANANTAIARHVAEKERADGLERDIIGLRRETSEADKAFEDFVTRPYRMAIARWWVDAWRDGGYSEEQAVKYSSDPMRALRSLITDSDLDAARKEAERGE